MLGIVTDAEEPMQEAFLRWRQAGDAPRSDEAPAKRARLGHETVLGPDQTLRHLL